MTWTGCGRGPSRPRSRKRAASLPESRPSFYSSPRFVPAMNARQPAAVNCRTGPDRSLVSRTATDSPRSANSTQFPFPLLRVLLRHLGDGELGMAIYHLLCDLSVIGEGYVKLRRASRMRVNESSG